jgi:aryl-alcohol dehydrogenase-like predicted oxidoreductase
MTQKKITRREFVRGGAIAALGVAAGLTPSKPASAEKKASPENILSYDERMEYRRLGKTGLMVSAISLGGHWKRLATTNAADFDKNRREVVAACIDHGINYVDACCSAEILAYAKALGTRRKEMYFGFSWYEWESRFPEWRSAKKLVEGFEEGLRRAKLEYVDLWRNSALLDGSRHTQRELEDMIVAGEKMLKEGKARFFGISSHDREWLDLVIRTYPQVSVILTPYTAKSKVKPKDSIFETVKNRDVGVFGIKPFASNSLFMGNSQDDSPTRDEDDRRARLALRYILTNDAITAPIPGLISIRQVKNAVQAIAERRQFDLTTAEHLDMELEPVREDMWANLPPDYHWLKNWEWV